jgi:hypothetical protein
LKAVANNGYYAHHYILLVPTPEAGDNPVTANDVIRLLAAIPASAAVTAGTTSSTPLRPDSHERLVNERQLNTLAQEWRIRHQ